MKICVVSPLPMQWEDNYKKVLSRHEVTWVKKPIPGRYDCTVFMWCNDDTIQHIRSTAQIKHGKYIVFIRRYEYYRMPLEQVDWNAVDAVVMVNDYLAKGFEARTGVTPHVIYNGVDHGKWTYKKREHGKNIAFVGFVNQKKNLPLAFQILKKLPPEYTLHIAGDIQCQETLDYLVNLGNSIKRRAIFYQHVTNINEWLEDKNYLLNTSISEGCPNSVIEALAKGIKCVIHNWPGAKEQFGFSGEHGSWVFDTVDEAVDMIHPGSPYDSEFYSEIAYFNYGLDQYAHVVNLIERVVNGD